MDEVRIVLRGDPRTKKNSQRIVRMGSYSKVLPSKAYAEYEAACYEQLRGWQRDGISEPVQVACTYFMRTRRRVDLVNLIEGTLDILVGAGVLADDNSAIVTGHDGSRVLYDREDPRVEVRIWQGN